MAFMCMPAVLWATRGPQDHGILLVVVFMIFTMPMGILLFSFLIYTISILSKKESPKKGKGKIVFVISIIIIVLTIVIPLAIMSGENWHPKVVKLMFGAFLPILVMAIGTTALAKRVKDRSMQE